MAYVKAQFCQICAITLFLGLKVDNNKKMIQIRKKNTAKS